MAIEETKYFNVKNTSVRLVHLGGVSIAPDKIVAIVDDEQGINRASISGMEDYLEITEEDASDALQVADAKVEKAAKAKATKADKAAATATGATWNAGTPNATK